jgi:hypothetical protein
LALLTDIEGKNREFVGKVVVVRKVVIVVEVIIVGNVIEILQCCACYD